MAVFTAMKAPGIAALVLALALALVSSAQTRAAFEAASIRPAPTQPSDFNVGLHMDGAQARFTYRSLRDYISTAYGVRVLQIVGPEWLGSEKFDIAAKLPDGATSAQIPEMLQRLLEERFHLRAHREMREFAVYALETAKAGVHLREVPDPDTGQTAAQTVNVTVTGTAAGVGYNFGNGSTLLFTPQGFDGRKVSMQNLAETLCWYLDRAVVDMTGLKGKYDFLLDVSGDDSRAMSIRGGVVAGVALPPSVLTALDKPWGDSLRSSLNKAGLTLASRKSPLEVVVVDSIEKQPTEN